MLINFSSPAYATITMFGEPAKRLIKLMGHRGEVPGALVAEEVPGALAQLQAGLARVSEPADTPDDGGYDTEPAVSLAKRALPLIEMLEAARAEECEVLWEEVR